MELSGQCKIIVNLAFRCLVERPDLAGAFPPSPIFRPELTEVRKEAKFRLYFR